jgi:hypothetical protein
LLRQIRPPKERLYQIKGRSVMNGPESLIRTLVAGGVET